MGSGEAGAARELLEEKAASGSPGDRALAWKTLGRIANRSGDFETAKSLLGRAITAHRGSGRRLDEIEDACLLAYRDHPAAPLRRRPQMALQPRGAARICRRGGRIFRRGGLSPGLSPRPAGRPGGRLPHRTRRARRRGGAGRARRPGTFRLDGRAAPGAPAPTAGPLARGGGALRRSAPRPAGRRLALRMGRPPHQPGLGVDPRPRGWRDDRGAGSPAHGSPRDLHRRNLRSARARTQWMAQSRPGPISRTAALGAL